MKILELGGDSAKQHEIKDSMDPFNNRIDTAKEWINEAGKNKKPQMHTWKNHGQREGHKEHFRNSEIRYSMIMTMNNNVLHTWK